MNTLAPAKLLVSLTFAAVMTLAAAPAAADDVAPNMLVYPLDPTLDLTSTREGWEKPFVVNPDCSEPPRPVINAPLPVQPFTVEEVVTLAKRAGRHIPAPISKPGPGLVQTKEHGAVSPAAYAAQLNHIENFLAQYGYSLRDSNLGTVARLRPRNLPCSPLRAPSLKPVPPDWHIREHLRRETIWRRDPVLLRWMSRGVFEPNRTMSVRGRRSFERWWSSPGTDWVGIEWRDAQRVQPRTASRAPMIASADMPPILEPILAVPRGLREVQFTAPGNVGVSMPMFFTGNGCGGSAIEPWCGPGDDHPSATRRRQAPKARRAASSSPLRARPVPAVCGRVSSCWP